MNNYFYVDVDDEITSVIGRLRKENSDEVFLVVPKRAIIAQSLVNLKLLGKEAGKLKKNLIFVSPDAQTRKIAEKAGLSVKKYVAQPKEKPAAEPGYAIPSKKRNLEHWEEEAAKEELKKVISKPKPVKIMPPKPPTKIKAGVYSVPKAAPPPPAAPVKPKPVVVLPEPEKIAPAAVKPQVVNLKEAHQMPKPVRPVTKPQFARANPFKIKKIVKSPPPSPKPAPPAIPEAGAEIPRQLERETANLTLREKERLRDLWMEQKGIVRGKSFQENTNLDLNAREAPKEELVSQGGGIFQTTHRRVVGSGKIIDLRAARSALPGAADLPAGKIPSKKGKEILLPLLNVKIFIVFIVGISVILVILAGIILPEAKVTIKPKSASQNLELKAWASGEVAQTDLGEKTIPAKTAHFKVNEENNFPATGEKQIQENSQGQVTIYNNSNQPLSLKQNAKLTDSAGNKFYTSAPITIPAAKLSSVDNSNTNANANSNSDSSASTKAGSGSVAISGENSNQDSKQKVGDSLDIPGLADGDYAGLVTAEISQEVKKGENRTAKIITQQDLDNAKNELVDRAKQDSADQVKNNFDADTAKEVRPEDLVAEDVAFTSDKTVGQEADSFNAKAEVSFFALAFSQDDLCNLAKKVIESDQENKDGTVEIQSYSLSDPQPLENKAEISARLDYRLVSRVDPNDVKKAILAKKKTEAEEYLKGRSDIESYTLNIWPNILGHLPVLERRINVEIQ